MAAPECTASINKSPGGSSNEVSVAATRRTTTVRDDLVGPPTTGTVLLPAGLHTRTDDGGYASSFDAGRRGRGSSSPPQVGDLPFRRRSAQVAQNVHSNEQIRASGDSGGRSASQHSQEGRMSSMVLRTRVSKQYDTPGIRLLDTVLNKRPSISDLVSLASAPVRNLTDVLLVDYVLSFTRNFRRS